MKPKNTLIAFVILIILVAVWLVIDQPFKEDVTTEDKVELVFPDFDQQQLKKMEIVSSGTTSQLLPDLNGVWTILDEDKSFPADAKAVETMLTKIKELKKADIVSTNPDKQNIYQVDAQGTEVKLYYDDADPRYHFFIGKNGPDFFSTFVRLDGQNEVFLVPEYLKSHFDKTPKTWKDRTLIAVEKERLTSLRIEKGDGSVLEFKKTGASWNITQPQESPADTQKVERLLNSLARYVATDYAEVLDPPDYGFEKPSMKLVVGLDDGTTKTVLLGKEKDTTGYYAKTEDRDWVFVVPKYRYTSFDKTWEEFKAEPTPVPEPPPVSEEQLPGSAAEPLPVGN